MEGQLSLLQNWKLACTGVVAGGRQMTPGRSARTWIADILMWRGPDIKEVMTMTEVGDK